MAALAAERGLFLLPGSGRAVLFDAKSGRELLSYYRNSQLAYPAGGGLPRRVRGLAGAIELAAELRLKGAA